MGKAPALRWRSEAPWEVATRNKSSIFTDILGGANLSHSRGSANLLAGFQLLGLRPLETWAAGALASRSPDRKVDLMIAFRPAAGQRFAIPVDFSVSSVSLW